MASPDGFSQKTVILESRTFSLRTSKFTNGYFISISEGEDRLGSMVASISAGPSPITTTIIPSKSESLLLRMTAERTSTRMRGIAVVSLYVRADLGQETAKALMAEIMDMIQDE